MASIFDLFSGSSGSQAAGKAGAAVQQGYKKAAGDVTQYTGQAIGTVGQGLPAYQQIMGYGTAEAPTYFGASGIGTPEQIAQAQQAWQSSIPYQQFQGQLPGIYEAALRRGGLTGQTGQIPIDLSNEAMKALDQFYPGWQQSINPYSYLTAGAAGQQGIYNTQAGLQSGEGTSLANLALGKAQAKANTIGQQYQAGQSAEQNQLSALFGLGSLAMAPFSGGASLGGLFGAGGGGSATGAYDPTWGQTAAYDASGALL